MNDVAPTSTAPAVDTAQPSTGGESLSPTPQSQSEGGDTPQEGISIDSRLSVGDETAAPQGDFDIPDAYKDRKWAQEEIKSTDDLWKRLDDLQKLSGKKSTPSDDADQAEWDAYYAKLRPESADKYEIKAPEGMEINTDAPEYKAALEMFYDSGLTNKQANDIYARYATDNVVDEAAKDADFDARMSEMYGDKSNDAIKTAARMMSGLDASAQEGFKALPNEQFVAVVQLMNNLAENMGEDKMPVGDGSASSGQKPIEDVRRELAALRTSKEARDFTHPDHAKTKQEIARMSDLVQKSFK